MKNKGEVIKSAWIAEIGEEKYNELKHLIDKSGFAEWNEAFKDCDLYSETEYTISKVRPMSIQGIETNNGWHRIDEVGLPSESMTCDFIINNSVYRGHYNKHVKQFHVVQDYFPTEDVTHYKEVKIVLPIY